MNTLKKKTHPNLVVIHNIYSTATFNVYIVMELCEQSLARYMSEKERNKKIISENEVVSILYQLLQGVNWLNKN